MTQEKIKLLFDYDPQGFFIEKTLRGARSKIGTKIIGGCHNKKPYRRLCVGSKLYYLHRLIFLWHRGYLPKQVDHINQDCTNNRIENLRAATNSQNVANQPGRSSTGFKGVYIQKACKAKPYVAKITFQKNVKYLGHFKTPEEAAYAYDKAAKECFGDFSYLNFRS